jgi:hypothetical protein
MGDGFVIHIQENDIINALLFGLCSKKDIVDPVFGKAENRSQIQEGKNQGRKGRGYKGGFLKGHGRTSLPVLGLQNAVRFAVFTGKLFKPGSIKRLYFSPKSGFCEGLFPVKRKLTGLFKKSTNFPVVFC